MPEAQSPGLRSPTPRWLRRIAPSSPGQSLVEFALGAVLLLALVFGIVEFGRAIYAYSVVANTAREAARYLAIHPTGDAEAHVAPMAVGVDVTIVADPITSSSTEVVVTASHQFQAMTPFVPDMELTSIASAVIEVH